MTKICIHCNKEFTTNQPGQKLCSIKCRKGIYSMRGHFKDIPAPTVGSISELRIAVDLLKTGHSVFRSLSSACFCDLVAIKDGKTRFLEARTGYLNYSKQIVFPKIIHSKNGFPTEYAVYCSEEDKVYYIPITEEDIKKYNKRK